MNKLFSILRYRLQNQGFGTTLSWAFNHLHRGLFGYPYYPDSDILPEMLVGGQYFVRGWKRMQSWGITGVVNLREEYDDLEAGIAPPKYLYLPTPDDAAPRVDQLCEGVGFIREIAQDGGKVYIHCGAGVGRAATLAAAYLVSKGLQPAEAWDTIRRVRPFIKLSPAQLDVIEEFARTKAWEG